MRDAKVVPVTVSEWQFSCCGQPFAIGDEVEWALSIAIMDDAWPREMSFEADVQPSVKQPFPDEDGAMMQIGDTSAWMPSPVPALSGSGVRVALFEERHDVTPVGMTPTRGIVRRIRVVEEEFRKPSDKPGGSYFRVVPASASFRDVPRAPESLWAPYSPGTEACRQVTGMLVDLEVLPDQ